MYPREKETNVYAYGGNYFYVCLTLSLSFSLYTALKKDLVLRLSSRQITNNFSHQFMSYCKFVIFHFYAWKPTPEKTRWAWWSKNKTPSFWIYDNSPEYDFIRLTLKGWWASNLDLLISLRERELLTKRSLSSPVLIALRRRCLKLHHLDCLTLYLFCLWVPWKRLSQEPTLSERVLMALAIVKQKKETRILRKVWIVLTDSNTKS